MQIRRPFTPTHPRDNVGNILITTGVVTALCLAKGWWIAAGVAAAMGPIGWVVAIIFIAVGVLFYFISLY